MIINIFSSIFLNYSIKIIFDLLQDFNLSSNTMFSILDLSLSTFLSLSSLLLPHIALQNLFLLHSSFQALFVSHSNASTMVMLISFNSSHSFLTLVTAVFSFSFTTLVFSSSPLKACTSLLSLGISAFFPLRLFSFGSQVIPYVLDFNHL